MNIIGGIHKGRTISMPKGAKIRPTSNKVREALFSILSNRVIDAEVLDLFAGSGSLGIEALSRGAARSIFIDNNINCIKIIRYNIKDLELLPQSKIMQLDAMQGIKKLSTDTKFDLIFLDPPYFNDWIKKALIKIDQYDILKTLGLAVCEHHKKELLPEKIGRLTRFKENRYGDTVLSFYRM